MAKKELKWSKFLLKKARTENEYCFEHLVESYSESFGHYKVASDKLVLVCQTHLEKTTAFACDDAEMIKYTDKKGNVLFEGKREDAPLKNFPNFKFVIDDALKNSKELTIDLVAIEEALKYAKAQIKDKESDYYKMDFVVVLATPEDDRNLQITLSLENTERLVEFCKFTNACTFNYTSPYRAICVCAEDMYCVLMPTTYFGNVDIDPNNKYISWDI